MPTSGFDYRGSDASASSGSPWARTLTIKDGLFSYYKSGGDLTVANGSPLVLSTPENGPMTVYRYDAISLDDIITISNPCPLVILCDSLTVEDQGGINVTGMGCKGSPLWTLADVTVPDTMALTGSGTTFKKAMAAIKDNRYFLGDPFLWQTPPAALGDVRATLTGGYALVDASGCGAGGAGTIAHAASDAGNAGAAGAYAPGGGGSGSSWSDSGDASAPAGAPGRPWGGGPGSGGATTSIGGAPDPWGGVPGIAGGTSSDGAKGGGVCIVICRGAVSIASGGVLQADGAVPSSGLYSNGGSGGGGLFAIVYKTSFTNSGALRANGGAATGSAPAGGAGGAGAAFSKSWTEMGW